MLPSNEERILKGIAEVYKQNATILEQLSFMKSYIIAHDYPNPTAGRKDWHNIGKGVPEETSPPEDQKFRL